MKYIKWCSIGIGSVLALIVASFFLANLSDETRDPRAQALIDKPLEFTQQGTKAFYYLLGVRASDPEHAEATGERLWKEALALTESQSQGNAFSKNIRRDVWPSVTFEEREGALSEQWKTRSEIREAVEKARPTIAQYTKLLSYGEISPLNATNFVTASELSPQMIFKGHKLYRCYLGELAAAGKWREAESLLRQEAHMMHSLLMGNTLLMTMISIVILHDDAKFLNEEIKLYPQLRVSKETISELQLPETQQMKEEALKTEMRYFVMALPLLRVRPFQSMVGEDAPDFTKYSSARWFLLPNEAVNKYYAYLQETLAHQCPDALDGCYESMQWANPKYPWQWLRNPMGKALFRIFATNIGARFQKLEIRKKQIDDLIVQLNGHVKN